LGKPKRRTQTRSTQTSTHVATAPTARLRLAQPFKRRIQRAVAVVGVGVHMANEGSPESARCRLLLLTEDARQCDVRTVVVL
jgi:hypothetical protein